MAIANIDPQITSDMIKTCPVGVITTDKNGNIISINQSLEDILGISTAELMGKNPDDMARDDLKTLFSDESTLAVVDTAGNRRILLHTHTNTENDSEKVAHVHYYQDHTELYALLEEKTKLNEEVNNLRLNDPVTGLLTERALFLALEPQVSRCRRYNNPLSIVYMAIEFDRDTLSEDEVHEKYLLVTHLLRDQLRWADLTGRVDQYFVIALPETSKQAANKLVGKMAENVEKLGGIQFTNFGISEWSKGDNTASLLRRADEAVEEAIQKKGKTNIVML